MKKLLSIALLALMVVIIVPVLAIGVQAMSIGTRDGAINYLERQWGLVVYSTGTENSNNFIPSTNNTSNLGSIAKQWKDIYANTLTDSGLTSGRIPIAGAGGLLSDDADLTFSGTSLQVGGANVTRTATCIVAGSKEPDYVKRQADLVADGISDELELLASIKAAGNVCATVRWIGEFTLGSTLVIPPLQNFRIDAYGSSLNAGGEFTGDLIQFDSLMNANIFLGSLQGRPATGKAVLHFKPVNGVPIDAGAVGITESSVGWSTVSLPPTVTTGAGIYFDASEGDILNSRFYGDALNGNQGSFDYGIYMPTPVHFFKQNVVDIIFIQDCKIVLQEGTSATDSIHSNQYNLIIESATTAGIVTYARNNIYETTMVSVPVLHTFEFQNGARSNIILGNQNISDQGWTDNSTQSYNTVITPSSAIDVTFTNFLPNGNFEVGDPPVLWLTSGTVARDGDTFKCGSYSVSVTNIEGSSGRVYYSIPSNLVSFYAGRKISVGAYVKASAASRAYIGIHDNVGGDWQASVSSYHTGDGTWQWLNVSRTVRAGVSNIDVALWTSPGAATTVYWDAAIGIEGNSPRAFSPKPDDMLISHHVLSYTISPFEDGKTIHTNLGSSSNVTLALPQVVASGFTTNIVVMAAQNLHIYPGAVGAIYINGAKQPDGKYISATAINDSVILVADGNGDWVATQTVGHWKVES